MDAHRARVTSLEFAAEGDRLLTGAADGTVRLWDVAQRSPIGAPLTVEPDAYVAATFASDGKRILAVPHFGRGVSWNVDPSAWEQEACDVAGRPLTEREWRDALPGRPFRRVC